MRARTAGIYTMLKSARIIDGACANVSVSGQAIQASAVAKVRRSRMKAGLLDSPAACPGIDSGDRLKRVNPMLRSG
jgi:hypothetical protein